MNFKFRPYQRIVVKDFMINGSRLDLSGTVQRYVLNRETKVWKVEVVLNSTYCLLDEDKIMDYDAYHEEKKNET
jgi:hypothetical protein